MEEKDNQKENSKKKEHDSTSSKPSLPVNDSSDKKVRYRTLPKSTNPIQAQKAADLMNEALEEEEKEEEEKKKQEEKETNVD